MSIKKYACPLPFNHMWISSDGSIRPCCLYRWDEVPDDLNVFHKDPFNHPYMQTIRKQMRNDEPVSGCSYCYNHEELNGDSHRIRAYRYSEIFGLHSFKNNTTPEITNLDLSISNTCNNKCRMCGPIYSTHWYSDAKKLGLDIPKGISTNPFLESGDFTKLKYIKFLGGEPLLEQDRIIDILEKCDLENLVVNIITNTSVVPNDILANLLDRCKGVVVSLSIDSYGKMNEFLRKGSNWEETVKTLEWFQNTKHHLHVNSVASIYNCNILMELIDYCNQLGITQRYVLVEKTDYMMPRHLPLDVKNKIIKELEQYIEVRDIFKVMIQELSNDGDYDIFYKNDNIMNSLRNEDWKKLNPKLADMLSGYNKASSGFI